MRLLASTKARMQGGLRSGFQNPGALGIPTIPQMPNFLSGSRSIFIAEMGLVAPWSLSICAAILAGFKSGAFAIWGLTKKEPIQLHRFPERFAIVDPSWGLDKCFHTLPLWGLAQEGTPAEAWLLI